MSMNLGDEKYSSSKNLKIYYEISGDLGASIDYSKLTMKNINISDYGRIFDIYTKYDTVEHAIIFNQYGKEQLLIIFEDHVLLYDKSYGQGIKKPLKYLDEIERKFDVIYRK